MERLAVDGGRPVREQALPLVRPYFDAADERAVAERVRSGWVAGDGPRCRAFEEAFASYLGVKHALLTTSCTAALDLAFAALALEPGEVIVPDFTFTSTALAPLLNGHQVTLCDVRPQTANIDPQQVVERIGPRTRAIVPVDYAGHPCRLDALTEIARAHDLALVHDAAQSCGSSFQGVRVGRQADVACFSFKSTKNLVTGEGGCLVTDDDALAERAHVIRDCGTDRRRHQASDAPGFYEYCALGNSYIQSDILGALALSQLEKLDWMNQVRARHAAYLNEALSGLPGIGLPHVEPDVETNWHLYAIRLPADRLPAFGAALRAEGIDCNTHYRPLHQNRLYRHLAGDGPDPFPGAAQVHRTLLRLPLYPGLEPQELADIAQAVGKVARALL